MIWNLKVHLLYGGDEFNLDFTVNENLMLALLRLSYNGLEKQLKGLMTLPSAVKPVGAVEDALVLIRCLTNNRLEEYHGKNLQITRLKK